MYSQCPECLTRFRVSAAALRAAHGTVRCGRCGIAFDALPRLSDTLQGDGSNSASGQPVPPGANGPSGITGATAAGLLATDVGDVPEFHFSADDIEHVFIDARDWQSRFGTPSSSGDRAGHVGDTSTSRLVGFLEHGETGDEVEPERDANDPPVWVHEPESVEDITLEGERIEIEGAGEFDLLAEDFLEREIAKEIEEQHRAEITGSHRGLKIPPAEAAAVAAEVGEDEGFDSLEPFFYDLDSTDRFEALADEPAAGALAGVPGTERTDSQLPIPAAADTADRAPDEPAAAPVSFESAALPEPDVAEPAETIAPPGTMPAAVAATVAAIASESTAAALAAAERPVVSPMSARWRRPAEVVAEDSFDISDSDPRLADDLAAAAGERSSAWAWGIGALLLVLLLAGQLTHHYRVSLARDATVGPVLRDVYARLGRPLPSNWNLAAFELRQWGANESAPSTAGTMTVRASLKNGARFAQPMPLLRLELEDRFGGTVARRDFQPAEYLKDPAQATRLLPAGASTEAELAVVGAAAEAVGYRLDVCLRDEAGAIRCAEPDGRSPAPAQAPQ